MYDSFEAGNIPAVLEKMDADIVWNEAENYPYADGNPYVGPALILYSMEYSPYGGRMGDL